MSIRLPLLPRWLRWFAVVAVAGLIFYLSIVTVPPAEPIVPDPPDLIPLDKWRHFLAYAAFGLSLAYATADWNVDARWLGVAVVGVAVLYGLGIELGQTLRPERYFSVDDAYANAFGGLLVTPWYVLRPYVTFTGVRSWVAYVHPRR